MEFLNKLDLRPKTILKFFGFGFLAIILISLAFKMISSSFSSISGLGSGGALFSESQVSSKMMANKIAYDSAESISLSSRNIAPSYSQGSTGDDAEDYEVTEYSGTIETRKLVEDCQVISSLKSKDYVIFENSSEYDTGCNYVFKVKKEFKEEVAAVIEALDPKDLSENIRTIKSAIDDFTSETEILVKKKETIESTLNDAVNSYDEIARVATQARDAESLAKIIDSKIRIIEKLSTERINITEQLDRLSRSKAEQLDRLDYVNFRIYIYENKFVDGEQIKDSWKSEVRQFVQDVNKVLQDSSIGLVKVILYILQFALYLLVVVIAIKLGWLLLRKIWKK